MITVVVCVGSSCFVRGSETVAETIDRLIRGEGIDARVEVTGAFCMERCSMGVSIRVNERTFWGVMPAEAEDFFYREVLPLAAVAVES